ncbi:MAG: KGK domain-containing protein [Heteroscytonema crispum UTEX LB 1556]
MEYNAYLQECGDRDVIAFEAGIFKVAKFREAVEYAFTHPNRLPRSLYSALYEHGVASSETTELLGDGVDCEVLKIGSKGWQKKGKLRIKVALEFIPDESENGEVEAELDDIPSMIA